MIRAKHIRMTPILRGETTVQKAELTDLRRKAVAHDGYVKASRRMGDLSTVVSRETEYGQGWWDCLSAFGELVIRDSAEPHSDSRRES